jgi:hypothetical protein
MEEGVRKLDEGAEGEGIMDPSSNPRISLPMASESSLLSPAWVHGRWKSCRGRAARWLEFDDGSQVLVVVLLALRPAHEGNPSA